MTAVRSRLSVGVAVLLLGGYGGWVVINAVKAGARWSFIVGVALLAAAVGAATGRRWSGYLIYALTALFAIEWVWIVVNTYRSGLLGNHLRSIPALQAVLSFVPAGGMFFLAGFCCYVAHRHVLGHARVRITAIDAETKSLVDRLPVTDDQEDAVYNNIQVTELNALNGMLAIILYKQKIGFYSEEIAVNDLSYRLAWQRLSHTGLNRA